MLAAGSEPLRALRGRGRVGDYVGRVNGLIRRNGWAIWCTEVSASAMHGRRTGRGAGVAVYYRRSGPTRHYGLLVREH